MTTPTPGEGATVAASYSGDDGREQSAGGVVAPVAQQLLDVQDQESRSEQRYVGKLEFFPVLGLGSGLESGLGWGLGYGFGSCLGMGSCLSTGLGTGLGSGLGSG